MKGKHCCNCTVLRQRLEYEKHWHGIHCLDYAETVRRLQAEIKQLKMPTKPKRKEWARWP